MSIERMQALDAFHAAREKFASDSSDAERIQVLETLKDRLLTGEQVTRKQNHRWVSLYAELLEFLMDQLDAKWRRNLTSTQEAELCDVFFLTDDFLEDSCLFLMRILDECSFCHKFDKAIFLVECILKSSSTLGRMFLRQCITVHDVIQREGRLELWKELVTCLVSLPDRLANKYQRKQPPNIFKADVYFHWMLQALIWCLQNLHHQLTIGIDCSTQFLSLVLGRCCLTGNTETIVPALTEFLSRVTLNDFLWRRISQKLFFGLPDNCGEPVLTCLFRSCQWYKILSRLLGNSLLDNKKQLFLVTNKLLLIRTFEEDQVLRNIIGYLADEEIRRKIYITVLLHLLDVWGNKSSLKHRSFVQHTYMTKALLIGIAHLTEESKTLHKQDFLRLIMHGVESHLSSPVLPVRRLGMFTAECIVKAVDPDGPQISFQYEKDEEILELEKLLTLPTHTCTAIDELSADVTRVEINDLKERGTEEINQMVSASNEDLDSDDDLEPYDMSNDTLFKKCPVPRYLRDCMAGLIDQNDAERTGTCLEAAEGLVRAESLGLQDVAVEMTKILLHLDNAVATPNFVQLRHRALTALTVHCPRQVSEYLCQQFYDRNYNLRQRMDILEVLVAASQELSQAKPKSTQLAAAALEVAAPSSSRFESPMPTTENWRLIIQKRIDAKTRRFGKGRSKPKPLQVVSRFSTVAGCFFYPLIKHYDRKEDSFDLLGSDFYLLGRLIYSLGMILHAAVNAPVATHIGHALLEFVWVLRYHVEPYVRQAIIFGICMTVVTVPSHALVSELHEGILDCQQWLKDVVTNDSDAECQQLAMKALLMIESAIKGTLLS